MQEAKSNLIEILFQFLFSLKSAHLNSVLICKSLYVFKKCFHLAAFMFFTPNCNPLAFSCRPLFSFHAQNSINVYVEGYIKFVLSFKTAFDAFKYKRA